MAGQADIDAAVRRFLTDMATHLQALDVRMHADIADTRQQDTDTAGRAVQAAIDQWEVGLRAAKREATARIPAVRPWAAQARIRRNLPPMLAAIERFTAPRLALCSEFRRDCEGRAAALEATFDSEMAQLFEGMSWPN